jgi:hypothetical protein
LFYNIAFCLELLRPDLIPKQIRTQTEQGRTRQDEKHYLRNISHVEIPHSRGFWQHGYGEGLMMR